MFASLAAATPNLFGDFLEPICAMFKAELIVTEEKNRENILIISNMFQAMSHLMPSIMENNSAKTTLEGTIPVISTILRKLATKNPNPIQFIEAFDFLERLKECTPQLPNNVVVSLIDLCKYIGKNSSIDVDIRFCAATYVGDLVHIDKNTVHEKNLVESIMNMIFNLMAIVPEDDNTGTKEAHIARLVVNLPPKQARLLGVGASHEDLRFQEATYLSIATIAGEWGNWFPWNRFLYSWITFCLVSPKKS